MNPQSRSLGPRGHVAAVAVRTTNWLSRRLGRGSGTVAGGRVGLALDPRLLSRLLAGRRVVLVTGTNGKTTTTALVRAAFGGSSVSNTTGANMPAGLVAALVTSDADLAILEVDEPWLGVVMDAASRAASRAVVVLNLSRDQLDRSSEVRQLADRWRRVFADRDRSREWTVIANVNDPLVAFAVEPAANVVACVVATTWRGDAASCPVCTKALTYQGSFRCPCHHEVMAIDNWTCDCGFAQPTPDVILGDRLHLGELRWDLELALPGEFNRANATLAAAVAARRGVDLASAIERMARVHDVAGRFDLRTWHGRTWRVMLAKNPAGVAALLQALDVRDDDLVVSINANVADGHDPSWLYDAPFDQLSGRRVFCDGTRALDLATRLDYAGVSTVLARDDSSFPGSIRAEGSIDVIANYTAFAEWLRKSQPC